MALDRELNIRVRWIIDDPTKDIQRFIGQISQTLGAAVTSTAQAARGTQELERRLSDTVKELDRVKTGYNQLVQQLGKVEQANRNVARAEAEANLQRARGQAVPVTDPRGSPQVRESEKELKRLQDFIRERERAIKAIKSQEPLSGGREQDIRTVTGGVRFDQIIREARRGINEIVEFVAKGGQLTDRLQGKFRGFSDEIHKIREARAQGHFEFVRAANTELQITNRTETRLRGLREEFDKNRVAVNQFHRDTFRILQEADRALFRATGRHLRGQLGEQLRTLEADQGLKETRQQAGLTSQELGRQIRLRQQLINLGVEEARHIREIVNLLDRQAIATGNIQKFQAARTGFAQRLEAVEARAGLDRLFQRLQAEAGVFEQTRGEGQSRARITQTAENVLNTATRLRVALRELGLDFDDFLTRKAGRNFDSLRKTMVDVNTVLGHGRLTLRLMGEEIPISRLATWAVGWTTVYRAINLVIGAMDALTIGAFRRFTDFQSRTVQLGGIISTLNPTVQFEQARRGAEALIMTTDRLSPQFIGTREQLERMIQAAVQFGVVTNLSTRESQEDFLVLANTVAALTQGMNQSIQVIQEFRSIGEGIIRPGAQLLQFVRALEPQLQQNLRIWAAKGTLVENISRLLPGQRAALEAQRQTLTQQLRIIEAQFEVFQRGLGRIPALVTAPLIRGLAGSDPRGAEGVGVGFGVGVAAGIAAGFIARRALVQNAVTLMLRQIGTVAGSAMGGAVVRSLLGVLLSPVGVGIALTGIITIMVARIFNARRQAAELAELRAAREIDPRTIIERARTAEAAFRLGVITPPEFVGRLRDEQMALADTIRDASARGGQDIQDLIRRYDDLGLKIRETTRTQRELNQEIQAILGEQQGRGRDPGIPRALTDPAERQLRDLERNRQLRGLNPGQVAEQLRAIRTVAEAERDLAKVTVQEAQNKARRLQDIELQIASGRRRSVEQIEGAAQQIRGQIAQNQRRLQELRQQEQALSGPLQKSGALTPEEVDAFRGRTGLTTLDEVQSAIREINRANTLLEASLQRQRQEQEALRQILADNVITTDELLRFARDYETSENRVKDILLQELEIQRELRELVNQRLELQARLERGQGQELRARMLELQAEFNRLREQFKGDPQALNLIERLFPQEVFRAVRENTENLLRQYQDFVERATQLEDRLREAITERNRAFAEIRIGRLEDQLQQTRIRFETLPSAGPADVRGFFNEQRRLQSQLFDERTRLLRQEIRDQSTRLEGLLNQRRLTVELIQAINQQRQAVRDLAEQERRAAREALERQAREQAETAQRNLERLRRLRERGLLPGAPVFEGGRTGGDLAIEQAERRLSVVQLREQALGFTPERAAEEINTRFDTIRLLRQQLAGGLVDPVAFEKERQQLLEEIDVIAKAGGEAKKAGDEAASGVEKAVKKLDDLIKGLEKDIERITKLITTSANQQLEQLRGPWLQLADYLKGPYLKIVSAAATAAGKVAGGGFGQGFADAYIETLTRLGIPLPQPQSPAPDKPPGKASGGPIEGTAPFMLHEGEYVLPRWAVELLGGQNQISRMLTALGGKHIPDGPTMDGFQHGGPVAAFRSGERNLPSQVRERAFRSWYANLVRMARLSGFELNPDPYDPRHFYDNRALWESGYNPQRHQHGPSQFKRLGHPDLIVGGVDTRTGKRATHDLYVANALSAQRMGEWLPEMGGFQHGGPVGMAMPFRRGQGPTDISFWRRLRLALGVAIPQSQLEEIISGVGGFTPAGAVLMPERDAARLVSQYFRKGRFVGKGIETGETGARVIEQIVGGKPQRFVVKPAKETTVFGESTREALNLADRLRFVAPTQMVEYAGRKFLVQPFIEQSDQAIEFLAKHKERIMALYRRSAHRAGGALEYDAFRTASDNPNMIFGQGPRGVRAYLVDVGSLVSKQTAIRRWLREYLPADVHNQVRRAIRIGAITPDEILNSPPFDAIRMLKAVGIDVPGFLRGGPVNIGMPSRQLGGPITQTGPHMLHAGEFVLPKQLVDMIGRIGSGGGTVININGVNVTDLLSPQAQSEIAQAVRQHAPQAVLSPNAERLAQRKLETGYSSNL